MWFQRHDPCVNSIERLLSKWFFNVQSENTRNNSINIFVICEQFSIQIKDEKSLEPRIPSNILVFFFFFNFLYCNIQHCWKTYRLNTLRIYGSTGVPIATYCIKMSYKCFGLGAAFLFLIFVIYLLNFHVLTIKLQFCFVFVFLLNKFYFLFSSITIIFPKPIYFYE